MGKLKELAENAILNWICNRPKFIFWRHSEHEYFTPFQLGFFLGMGRKHGKDLKSVAKALTRIQPCAFKSAQIEFSCDDDGDRPGFAIRLNHAFEWEDLALEAFAAKGAKTTPSLLSEDGQKLLTWIRKDGERSEWNSSATIGRQSEMSGTSWTPDRIKSHLDEIQRKEEPGLIYEEDDKCFKIQVELRKPPAPFVGPINPDFQLASVDDFGHRELHEFADKVRRVIETTTFPENGSVVRLYQIQSRKDVVRFIAPNPKGSFNTYHICDFLRSVRLHPGITLGFSFKNPDPWFVDMQPKQGWDWPTIQEELARKRREPRLEEKYGLGDESAALLRWIESLDESECLRNLTPAVEDHFKKRIGLSSKDYKENLPVYIQMLIDEINQKTEYDLKIQPWRHYNSETTRILINKQRPELDCIVRDIQIHALDQGIHLSCESVRACIARLIEKSITARQ